MKLPKKAQMEALLHPRKAKNNQATCPRCKSVRLQRGYKDSSILLSLVRRHELLCNNCGLEYKEFDLWAGLTRTPSTNKQSVINRRRAPRYRSHLPVTISLAERHASGDKLVLSKASRGHCDVISKVGVGLSFVGARFAEREFTHTGRLLFVSISLPNSAVDALVTTVTHKRVATGTPSWFISATITQMTEKDTEHLAAYLAERAKKEPVFLQE